MAFIISLPAWLHLLCGIYAIQQRLASKIEVLRKDSAVVRRAAPGRRRASPSVSAAPGGDGFIDQSGSDQQR